MAAPGFAQAYNFTNTLNSLNRDHSLTDYIIDLVFESMKGLDFMRQREMVEEVPGGLAATWMVNVGKSPNTVWYAGDQDLPIASLNNNIYPAALDWKFLDDALTVLFTDVLMNDGSPDAVANYVTAQLDITKMSIVQGLATAWITNTFLLNPLAVDGLAGSIDNGTVVPTYAGIPVTAGAVGNLWGCATQTNYNVTGSLLGNMQTLDIAAQIDNARPDFYMTNRLNYASVIALLTTLDRYIQPDLARTTGSVDVSFNSGPLFIDSNVPTGVASPSTGTGSGGVIYGLNSRYLKLVVLRGAYFDVEEWQKSQTNNTYFTRIHLGCNLVNFKPAAHWVLWNSGG
jgi:hypothetical protein